MKPRKKKHNKGGARPGAGRPPLVPGQKVVAKSISMHPTEWDRLDAQRGDEKRGRYIASLLTKGDK